MGHMDRAEQLSDGFVHGCFLLFQKEKAAAGLLRAAGW
jgi:hypothetical protein